MGFTHLACESCVSYRKTDHGTTIAALHIENDRLKDQMWTVWLISDLGMPRFVIRITVKWDQQHSLVCLSQTSLIDKIISQFGQKSAMPLSLPMDPGIKLRKIGRASLSQEELNTIQRTPYCSLVGCLLYLAISTHPDIAYVVGQLTQFVENYTRVHWTAAI